MGENFMLVPVTIYIDSNSINAKSKISAMNQIYKWRDEEKLIVIHTDKPMEELTEGSLQWEKIGENIEERLFYTNPSYRIDFENIRDILFPDLKDVLVPFVDRKKLSKDLLRKVRDIEHLCGYKHGYGVFFLTYDKQHILSKRQDLEKIKIKGIMTPEECMSILSKKSLKTYKKK